MDWYCSETNNFFYKTSDESIWARPNVTRTLTILDFHRIWVTACFQLTARVLTRWIYHIGGNLQESPSCDTLLNQPVRCWSRLLLPVCHSSCPPGSRVRLALVLPVTINNEQKGIGQQTKILLRSPEWSIGLYKKILSIILWAGVIISFYCCGSFAVICERLKLHLWTT